MTDPAPSSGPVGTPPSGPAGAPSSGPAVAPSSDPVPTPAPVIATTTKVASSGTSAAFLAATTQEPAPTTTGAPAAATPAPVATTVTLTTTTAANLTQGNASAAAAVAKAAIANAAKALLGNLGSGGSASLQTSVGVLEVFRLDPNASSPVSVAGQGGTKVSLSPGILKSLPAGAVLGVLGFAPDNDSSGGGGRDRFADVPSDGGGQLASPSMDITVFDSSGDPVSVTLPEPLLFKLTDSSTSNAKCVFLETQADGSSLKWSSAGVRVATQAEIVAAGETPGGVWCMTEHLSIFAALAEIILGCLNVELLTPAAMSAVSKNEGWWSSRSSIEMFILSALLLLCLILGWCRQRWAMRLGCTTETGRSMTTCWQMKTLGFKGLLQLFVTGIPSRHGDPNIRLAVQEFLAVRTGTSTICIAQHCWNGGVWIDTPASLPHKVLLDKVMMYSGGVEDVLMNEMFGSNCKQALWRLWRLFLATHPLFDAMRVADLSQTCTKRVTLVLVSITGVLAVNTLIFNFSGSTRGWESPAECPIDPASHWFIFVSTLTSTILNTIPNLILLEIAHQSLGRPLLGCIFWVWTLGYMVLTAGLVIIALANLNREDESTWFFGLQYSLCMKLILFPFAMAAKQWLLLEIHLWKDKTERQQYLTTWGLSNAREEQMSEAGKKAAEDLAYRSIAAADLVNFLAQLGGKVMPGFDPLSSTSGDVLNGAIKMENSNSSLRAFSKLGQGDLPPDKLIVHSMTGNFAHLVASLLSDILGEKASYDDVLKKILSKDFDGLQQMLTDAQCSDFRFWIDIFATSLMRGSHVWTGKSSSTWHEELLVALPTIIRCLTRACCDQISADINAGKPPRCGILVQILVLDQDHQLPSAGTSLAEVMAAREFKTRQRALLHPDHLKGPELGQQLKKFKDTIKLSDWCSTEPWVQPYLEDKQAVYDALEELIVGGVQTQRGSTQAIFTELAMSDIFSSVVAVQAHQQALEGVALNLGVVGQGGLDPTR